MPTWLYLAGCGAKSPLPAPTDAHPVLVTMAPAGSQHAPWGTAAIPELAQGQGLSQMA